MGSAVGSVDSSINRVWLTGERAGEHHLLDVVSGKVVQTVHQGGEIRRTAGMGQSCGRRFVSVYVAPDRETVVLQVDRRRYPLDGRTFLSHRSRLGGMVSQLTIQRAGAGTQVLRRSNIAGTVLRKIDPGYDELDASLDDYLADIADIAWSERRLAWIREIKDPTAGPWELMS